MSKHYSLNNTEYWIYNDSPKLPVVIMVHGLRGTHHGLDLIAKCLTGYRIIVPDLPGFGESKPLSTQHSVENYVEWLRSFIMNLNLSKPPVLLGHSFGSIIASHFAKKYPDSIDKLILENPIGAPILKGPKAILTYLASFFYWLGHILPEPIGSKLLASKASVMVMSIKLAKTRDKKLRKFIHNQHLQHFSSYANRNVVDEAYRASTHSNVRDVAPYINTPTLLIAGDKDDVTPLKKQKQLEELFPKAKLVVIKNVGHLTHYETPKNVANAITNFLR
jgi:pimeloyl-ACP methyl ester carboxylesterase